MRVYGYTRVSTVAQSEEGVSLEAQHRQIEGYAMMHGLVLSEVFVERGVSGWKPLVNRPEGSRLTATLRAGDVVLCPKLDRMFRSARDALVVSDDLKKQKVRLHLLDLGGDVTGNGVSKMFFTIVAAFAEFERDRIVERIIDTKASEKMKGRYLGGSRPFGFYVDEEGFLVRDEDEQIIVRKILSLRGSGKSLRVIAKAVSTCQRKVSHMLVRRIIKESQTN